MISKVSGRSDSHLLCIAGVPKGTACCLLNADCTKRNRSGYQLCCPYCMRHVQEMSITNVDSSQIGLCHVLGISILKCDAIHSDWQRLLQLPHTIALTQCPQRMPLHPILSSPSQPNPPPPSHRALLSPPLPRPRMIPPSPRRPLHLRLCILNRHPPVPHNLPFHLNPAKKPLPRRRLPVEPPPVIQPHPQLLARRPHGVVLPLQLKFLPPALRVQVQLGGSVDGPVAEGAEAGEP